MTKLQGRCISPGAAEGIARVRGPSGWLAAAAGVLTDLEPRAETERLQAARTRAAAQLDRVRRQLIQQGRNQDALIFAAHASILSDSRFLARVEEQIHQSGLSAEAAIAAVVEQLCATFRASELPAIQDKVADILDIGRRLIQCLSQKSDSEDLAGCIIVASAVMPSELVGYSHQKVAGIITETCGFKSHTAIVARGLGIPFITGITTVDSIPDGVVLLMETESGTVIVETGDESADADEIKRIRGKIAEHMSADADRSPIATADGEPVTVLLNISDPLEAEAVPKINAAGVGLFRTEFLYMDRPWWPTEEESYSVYHRVAEAIGETELHIRLADFGAEKCPPYGDIPVNRNPSLGIRGMRLLLERDDILRPQVLALKRLGAERPVTVLLPMIDTADMLNIAIRRLCEFCGCTDRSQLPFRIAAMIEVPAAALMADILSASVDSLSVGLNDLTQYLLAADRDDELVEKYHDPLQPGVLRVVKRVIDAAAAAGKPLTFCGELAGDPQLTAVLLAFGARRFSVSRSHFHAAAKLVRSLSAVELRTSCDALLNATTGTEVRALLGRRVVDADDSVTCSSSE